MANSTMVGTGLTPEGINQNYVIYDLMLDMGWSDTSVNLTKWYSFFFFAIFIIAAV
jgi:alpha-N-acetylglucosaminidase